MHCTIHIYYSIAGTVLMHLEFTTHNRNKCKIVLNNLDGRAFTISL